MKTLELKNVSKSSLRLLKMRSRKTFTKSDILSIKRRYNEMKYKDDGSRMIRSLYSYYSDHRIEAAITKEQSDFGIQWLLQACFKKNGQKRNCKLVSQLSDIDFDIVANFSHFTFVGFIQDDQAYNQYSGLYFAATPVYRVYAKNGKYFDYAFAHWSQEIEIVA